MEWTIEGEYYVANHKDVSLKIKRNKLNRETHAFAYNVVTSYKTNEAKIIKCILENLVLTYGFFKIDKNLIKKFENPVIELEVNDNPMTFWMDFLIDDTIVVCKFNDEFDLLDIYAKNK
jgi:hypothetical protein